MNTNETDMPLHPIRYIYNDIEDVYEFLQILPVNPFRLDSHYKKDRFTKFYCQNFLSQIIIFKKSLKSVILD